MCKKVVLLTLQTFGTTGGIQKMSRTLAHSLYTLCVKRSWHFKMESLYDTENDLLERYVPLANFRGYNKNLFKFTVKNVFAADKPDVVVLTHINLAVIGLLLKTFKPGTKIWLIAHGVELWRPISLAKKLFLKRCDKIICVSNFTKAQLNSWHHISGKKCVVVNNALDPFVAQPTSFVKPPYLLNRYSLTEDQPVIFTLTRLASSEMYKGHDKVIKTIGRLKNKFTGIKYILAGQYDEIEGERLKQLIEETGTADEVVLTGFIDEHELTDHFLLADMFVLPSKKEGFGIVFIEALACGLPVICGNADGSIDAIRNGELGQAIDTDDENELRESIAQNLSAPLTLQQRKQLQEKCVRYFNEDTYKKNLEKLLIDE